MRKVDTALLGDPPRQRRGFHPATVDALLGLARTLGPLFAATLALVLALGRGGLALLGGLFLCHLRRLFRLGFRLARLGGHVLALLADHGDRLPDLDLLAFLREDLEEDAAGLGLDLLGHLLGVELVERIALLNLVPLRLQPADDRARLHALAETRERDLAAHSLPTVRLIAARTSCAWGITNSSMIGAKGSGVNFAPTRSTGASR